MGPHVRIAKVIGDAQLERQCVFIAQQAYTFKIGL